MDDAIIKRVLNGQTHDFEKLITKYYNELFIFIHNQVNDIETTKDLLQEIFMLLYNKLHTYNGDKASFRTWMYRVANNYTINYLKKKRVYTIKTIDFNQIKDTNHQDVLQRMIHQEDVKFVLSTMKKVLSKKHYRILTMYFFSPLSNDEIGNLFQIQGKTVGNIVSLSIQKIKQRIEGDLDG